MIGTVEQVVAAVESTGKRARVWQGYGKLRVYVGDKDGYAELSPANEITWVQDKLVGFSWRENVAKYEAHIAEHPVDAEP